MSTRYYTIWEVDPDYPLKQWISKGSFHATSEEDCLRQFDNSGYYLNPNTEHVITVQP